MSAGCGAACLQLEDQATSSKLVKSSCHDVSCILLRAYQIAFRDVSCGMWSVAVGVPQRWAEGLFEAGFDAVST